MSDEAARPDGPALPRCPHCGGDHAPHLLKCPQTDMPLPLEQRRDQLVPAERDDDNENPDVPAPQFVVQV
ncbi:MAG: hypothetical protein AB1Z98_15355, partial [Nannocystaceae bacterium]